MATQPVSDFPVPTDLAGFWVWEKLHCPRPVAPLEQDLLVKACAQGFNRSMAEYGSIIELGARFINNYLYVSFVPRDLNGGNRQLQLETGQAQVAGLMPHIGRLWQDEWLPSLLPALETARTTDFGRLGDQELLQTFEDMRRGVVERWSVHGKINYAFYAAGIFGDFYNETFKPDDATEAYEALQGFPSIALESSRGLWRLSRLARSEAGLRRIFEDAQPAQLPAQLQATEAGRAFLLELNAYLEDFGWRTDSIFELTKKPWREDPAIALNAIQGYVNIGDEGGPDAQYHAAVRRREALLDEARRRLAGDPAKLARFEELYETAACFTPVAEDHNHYIDQMGNIVMRYPALEIGRRLVTRGSIAGEDDVFFLHLPEVQEGMGGRDLKAVATQRRQDLARWSAVVPPPVLGTPQEPSGDPAEDLLMRFFGSPVEPSTDPSIITGTPASPGTVRGPAKVVRDLTEASKVSPGDILVCEMTLPPWTPLFATISAVVADTGGILSHCAIVAREYRIPCVVGTAFGTAVIKDGMTLTVDGSKGIVRIEPD
ncbi:MAG TPA: PEP-utilizing enzyme [Dehalococcoidia bacterium]|nr:PEP-utilizing enzyme [Dehalococcoidia bacterium]